MHVRSRWLPPVGGIAALLLSGCLSTSPRLVKIGLVAPFEGRYREVGVDVIPAARLAIREWAAQHGDAAIGIELVAYDDAGDPAQAAAQAHKLVADPAVEVVIGHWLTETTAAAAPIYAHAGLPVITYTPDDIPIEAKAHNLSPSLEQLQNAAESWAQTQLVPIDVRVSDGDIMGELEQVQEAPSSNVKLGGPVWGLLQFYALSGGNAEGSYFITGPALPDDATGDYWTEEHREAFITGFETGSLGAPPGLLSMTAYEATWLALDIIAADHGIANDVSPAQRLRFDENQRLDPAAVYLYQWEGGQRRLSEILP